MIRKQKTITVREHDTQPYPAHVEVVLDTISGRGWAAMGGRMILSGMPGELVPCVEWVSPAVQHAAEEALKSLVAEQPAPEPEPAPEPVSAPPEPPAKDAEDTKPDVPKPRRRRVSK